MGRRKILDQKGLNYLTMTVVGWIDVFSRPIYRDIIIESLDFCRKKKGLIIVAYVIMSNHIHLIAQADVSTEQGLSEIVRDFKKFTAKQIIAAIKSQPESRREWLLHMFKYYAKYNTNNREYQFWIQNNHPTALWHPEVIWQKIDYIHLNPVRAKIVAESDQYLYSSASNYASENKNGLLEIDLIDLPPFGVSQLYFPK